MASNPYKPQVIVKNGKATAVILDIRDYEAMLEQLEQIEDLKAIRAMKKADWQTVSFDQYLQGRRKRASA